MTDVLDRLETEPIPITDVPADASGAELRPRITLAALSVGAGAIHLAMVPAHLAAWTLEGAAFLAAAWIPLGTAFLAVTRPSRRLWLATILLNCAFVAAWGVSRTSGFPMEPQKGIAESMSLVDITCVLFELGLIVGALGMVSLPTVPSKQLSAAGARWVAGLRKTTPPHDHHESEHGHPDE